MGGRRFAAACRRFRRARVRDRGQRGVAAVVGTLLALLVFFALFGLFLTQYLPLWMTVDELQFSTQAESAMAILKSDIDAQYALGGPTSYGVPFPISSQSVPLLAQPTQAILALQPPTCSAGFYTGNGTPVQPKACVYQHLVMALGSTAGTTLPFNVTASTSLLEMQLPNRYYTPQTYFLEDDAIVQIQPGGHQILALPPPFNISKVGTNVSVTGSFLEVFGTSAIVVGQGTENVFSQLLFSQSVSSVGRFVSKAHTPIPFNFTYQVGTRNLCGWYNYFNNVTVPSGVTVTLTASSGGSVALPPNSGICLNGAAQTYILTYTVSAVTFATVSYAGVALSLGVGGA